MFSQLLIWVRGAGELGSAVAWTLHKVGMPVFLSDIAQPLAIRRPVTFSDAVLTGTSEVEGIGAVLTETGNVRDKANSASIPIVADSPGIEARTSPSYIVDARMLKRAPENPHENMIGLGPGFIAGHHCLAVVETARGHDLGRVIWDGQALADTGIPGAIGGETGRRVVHAPGDGTLQWQVEFGDLVDEEEVIGLLNDDRPIRAGLKGMVRGLISPGTPIAAGLKIADIDPRRKAVDYFQISDKARAVSRGVLEAILTSLNEPGD